MVNNKDIIKIIGGKSGGGKINSESVSIGISLSSGKVFYGLSDVKMNPTRDFNNKSDFISTRFESVIKWSNNREYKRGQLPRERTISSKNPNKSPEEKLSNCSEFNVVNNATNHECLPNELYLYSINRRTFMKKDPCENCQSLYFNYIKKFIDFEEINKYTEFDYDNY